MSDLEIPDFTNSQKSSQSQLCINSGQANTMHNAMSSNGDTNTTDNKQALHAVLAQQQYENLQQQQHDQLQLEHEQQLQQHHALYQQPPVQTPILGKEEFAGQYNFQLLLNPSVSGKHWIFSEKLSKVFIHMEEVLPLQFQWTPPVDGLWLRATLVFKLDQYRSEPVVRCHNHMAISNSSNRDINQTEVQHVIRCLHATSIYQKSHNGHLSVLIPLGAPEAGMAHVPVDYKFFCKNSCAHGMNRRATEIIFTLENQQNLILGRRKMEIRICSCPKRDKDKEEMDSDPKGFMVQKTTTSTYKKRKPSSNVDFPQPMVHKKKMFENQVFNLNLSICGRDNAIAVMKYACDVMSGCGVRNENLDIYKPYIDKIQKEMSRVE
ncbi:cellular tumor antigen p53 isoform X2 [Copidosoma floridanum]|nr:cellular tumor antigen p53 isoform X2 [Copidosoma floridanum]XP_014208442.1 cellular tumor antigen p53 isoform X2 [Copidosoma floridanum]XP_014208443.1 cellular tumor antigen p53 isoform X2 [Copidosoma floridanum]XP_023244938.1 cellular tumor antigen p53 isoform X2 [Copidosoma floridanum]